MIPSLRSLLLALLLLPLALPTYGQFYFNERLQLARGFSSANSLLPNGSLGYWIAGSAVLTPGGNQLALILQHIDETGLPDQPPKTWQQLNTNYYATSGNGLLPLPDGGMVLIGNSDQWVNGVRIPCGNLWRFNAQGDTLWTRTYSEPSGADVQPRAGCRLSDGSYVLIGESYSSQSSTGSDILLLRTNSLGHERWRRLFHQDYFDGGGSVIPTRDGGFLLACGFSPFSVNPTWAHDILLLKVDSAGREQQRLLIGGDYEDYPGPLQATTDGGFVMAGVWSDTVLGNYSQGRPTLFWLDSTGTTLLRKRSYGPGHSNTGPTSLLALSDGGYLWSGQIADTANSPAPGFGYAAGLLMRVCADGDSVWYRTYKNLTSGFSSNYLRTVKVTPDGGFAGAGFVFPRAPDTGTQDTWVFKTDADGYLQPGGAPPSLVCTPVGLPAPPPPPTGAIELWPNPAPDGRYHLRGAPPGTELEVRDPLGRLIWHGPTTNGAATLDMSPQAPGLYWLRLTSPDGRSSTRKLVRE